MQGSNKIFDQSFVNLNEVQSPKKKKTSSKIILPKIDNEDLQEPSNSSPKKTKKKSKKRVPPGYEVADFDTALGFLHTQSYRKKTTIDGQGQTFQPFGVCDDLSSLKQYGLGIYLYLEFIKRLFFVFILISGLVTPAIMWNYLGDGLSNYTDSFTLILAKFSLGNLSDADQVAYLTITICDILTMFFLFGFYVHWRIFVNDLIDEEYRDHSTVNPANYALTVVGFDKSTQNLQQNLKAYFDGLYRGAYEVEVVYDYNGNFKKFIQYDEAIEQVEKEKQVIKQAEKDKEDLTIYEQKLQKIEEQLSHVAQTFEPLYAIIHFRNFKSKYAFINTCKKYALVDKFSYKFKRCICCMPSPPERQRFRNQDDLIIKQLNLARPEQYNWNSLDISACSRFLRMLFSILLLIIIIFVFSTLIVFCTLYVSSTSSCSNFDSNMTTAQALQADEQTLYCYCNANFASIYLNSEIQNACTNLQQKILISNGLQIGASLVSAISNVILIVIVGFIGEYLLKPETKPIQYSFVFVGVLVSNYFNSTLLPLILNGNIYGFQSSTYLTWATFIDFSRVSIFKDFDSDWFAVISPYYTNFFIIACLTPIIQLVMFCIRRSFRNWRVKRKCQTDDPHSIIIQKQANAMIVDLVFDYPAQQALVCLQLFMCFMYSSLIPLLVPLFTLNLLLSFFCKRYILVHFSVRIPANENLAQKITNLLPFIILIHGLMAVWSHTVPGFFASDSNPINLGLNFEIDIVDRAFSDILLLGASALILVWIIFDWIILGFCSCLRDCSKDDLQLPVSLAAVENTPYSERIRKANILGSYKVINNPYYGHAIKAYKELMKYKSLEKSDGQ